MNWFKHRVASGDDPDIDDSFTLFGPAGPYVFFRALEVMSREFDINNPGINDFSVEFFRGKFRTSWRKTVKVLEFFSDRKRIILSFYENKHFKMIRLNCPKLKEDCDEYTQKQLNKLSGQNPDSSRDKVRSKKVEAEVEVDLKELPTADLQEKTSKHFKDQITDDNYLNRLNDIGEELTKLKSDFNWWQMIQLYFNKRYHPGAIIDTLGIIKGYLITDTLKSTPWAVGNKVIPIKSQNYNEQDTRLAHEAIKNQIEADPEIKAIAARLFNKPMTGKRKMGNGTDYRKPYDR